MTVSSQYKDAVAYAMLQVDKYVSPATREKAYKSLQEYSRKNPYLASFLATEALFAALPVLAFAAFSVGVVLTGALAAAGFVLFWVGVALCSLATVLAFTGTAAGVAWVWFAGLAVSGQYAMQGFNKLREASGRKTDARKKGKVVFDGAEDESDGDYLHGEKNGSANGGGIKVQG